MLGVWVTQRARPEVTPRPFHARGSWALPGGLGPIPPRHDVRDKGFSSLLRPGARTATRAWGKLFPAEPRSLPPTVRPPPPRESPEQTRVREATPGLR